MTTVGYGVVKLGDDLSARELQVLRLVAEGLSNLAIGGRLFLAEDTIKAHMSRVFRKLGVSDRSSAVMAGLRLGLLRADVPPPAPAVPGVVSPEAVGLLVSVAEAVAAGKPLALVRRSAVEALTAAGRRGPGGRPLVPGSRVSS